MIGGSPPQVRGKRISSTNFIFISGITPAGAGKTKCKLSQRAFRKDHPRRCGENTPICQFSGISMGSPPQVRGKLRARCRLHDINRITPAGAGKTLKQKRQYAVNEDHPRRCGENTPPSVSISIRTGSPPQVRGKLQLRAKGLLLPRITPAGAGKTGFAGLC